MVCGRCGSARAGTAFDYNRTVLNEILICEHIVFIASIREQESVVGGCCFGYLDARSLA